MLLSSYRNTIINQSARVFSLSYFLIQNKSCWKSSKVLFSWKIRAFFALESPILSWTLTCFEREKQVICFREIYRSQSIYSTHQARNKTKNIRAIITLYYYVQHFEKPLHALLWWQAKMTARICNTLMMKGSAFRFIRQNNVCTILD